ncbi:hypothetical protein EJB05_28026, partial [Eragrostis curvula]
MAKHGWPFMCESRYPTVVASISSRTLSRRHGLFLYRAAFPLLLTVVVVVVRRRRRDGAGEGRGGATSGAGVEDGAGGEEEVELRVPHLEEVLGVELDGGRAGEVVRALDEAPVLAEHLEREAAAGEVVEDARVAAGDVHAAAEGAEVHVHVVGLRRRGAGDGAGAVPAAAVAAEDDGVGLHVVLEALALQLGEAHLQVRRR